MDPGTRAVEQIKIFRDFAKYYFSVRSNVTYLNVLACGSFTYFFTAPFLAPESNAVTINSFVPATQPEAILERSFWLYVGGCIAYIGVACWASALCNLMSNSFCSYMDMSVRAERNMGIRYDDYTTKSWAVTYEFLNEKAKGEILGPALQGNVWNTFNAFLAAYGLYALAIITSVHAPSTFVSCIFSLATAGFLDVMFIIFFFAFVPRWIGFLIWLPVCAGLCAPLAGNFPDVPLHASKIALVCGVGIALVIALVMSVVLKTGSTREEI